MPSDLCFPRLVMAVVPCPGVHDVQHAHEHLSADEVLSEITMPVAECQTSFVQAPVMMLLRCTGHQRRDTGEHHRRWRFLP